MQEDDFSVSQPTGFRHAAHIGPEGVTVQDGFRVQDLPVEYVNLFRRAGLSKRELKTPDTLAFAPCLCGQLGARPSDRHSLQARRIRKPLSALSLLTTLVARTRRRTRCSVHCG